MRNTRNKNYSENSHKTTQRGVTHTHTHLGRGGLKAAFGRAPKLGNLAAEAPRPQFSKFIRKTIRKMVGFQGGAQIRESGSGGAVLYRSAACDENT